MKKSRCLLCVLVCFIAFSVSACGKTQDVQHEQSAVKNETGQAEKELTEKEEVKITSDQKTPVEKKETPIADNASLIGSFFIPFIIYLISVGCAKRTGFKSEYRRKYGK